MLAPIIMEEKDQGQEKELTLDQVAARLGVSYDTALRRVKKKIIRARKEGKEWRVKVSDLEKYIESTYEWGNRGEEDE